MLGSTICNDHLELDDCAGQKVWVTFSSGKRCREFLTAYRQVPPVTLPFPSLRLASIHVQELIAAQ